MGSNPMEAAFPRCPYIRAAPQALPLPMRCLQPQPFRAVPHTEAMGREGKPRDCFPPGGKGTFRAPGIPAGIDMGGRAPARPSSQGDPGGPQRHVDTLESYPKVWLAKSPYGSQLLFLG